MRYPTISLTGAVVLVTGGGRGIGAATAARFARTGATVWIGDLDLDVAEQTAAGIGGAARAHPLDVTDRRSFMAFAGAALAAHGHIDVLVNNAGVMPLGDFLTEPDAVSRTTFDVNVWGLINGMRTVLPHLIERRKGHVVNVASMAGKIPIPGMAIYDGSKFAALGLPLAVREEYARHGVSVSTVLPSAVRTRLASGMPLGRGLPTVDPDDVAMAVLGSVSHRRAEIPVPGYLAGDRRALTSVDHVSRDRYERAIDEQARGRERSS